MSNVPFSGSNPLFHVDGGCGYKLYTLDHTGKPVATYLDREYTATNTNPVILDSNGDAIVYLLPQHYSFILTDASDVVQSGYPLHGIHGGQYTADLVSCKAIYDSIESKLNTLLGDIAELDSRLLLNEADYDTKSDTSHTHEAEDITNLSTGIDGDPESSAALLFRHDYTTATTTQKTIIAFGSTVNSPPAGWTFMPLTTSLDTGVLNQYFIVNDDGQLECIADCNILFQFDVLGQNAVGLSPDVQLGYNGACLYADGGSIYVKPVELYKNGSLLAGGSFSRYNLLGGNSW